MENADGDDSVACRNSDSVDSNKSYSSSRSGKKENMDGVRIVIIMRKRKDEDEKMDDGDKGGRGGKDAAEKTMNEDEKRDDGDKGVEEERML